MRGRPSASALLVLIVAATQARRNRAGPLEVGVFHLANRRSDAWHIPMWVVMQAGSLGAVWVAAAIVGIAHGRGPACRVAGVGTSVWAGVKVLKRCVGRGRPAAMLPGVIVRGGTQAGLGFPSGHAAVSITSALLIPWRSDTQRIAALVGAGIVGVSRMYVGAHLPLDVVGGFAIGSIAGTAAQRT